MHGRPIHGGNLVWAATIANCSKSEIVDFSASINPLGPPKSAIEAIDRAIADLKAYPDPNYSQLRSCLGKYHQLPSEWILPGNGAAELLTWAARELSQWEITYLHTPAFADYWRAFSTFSVNVRRLQLDLDNLSIVNDRISGKNCGILINNPHNPTGKMWQIAEILPYLENFALVVVDEAFMDFLPPDREQSLIALIRNYPNLIILRSLTKFYTLPGLRLGYAISHPERLRKWQKWRDPWAVNVLAAAAGMAVLEDRDFQKQTWEWLINAKSQLLTGLGAIDGLQPFPGAANFLLVRTSVSSSQLQTKLLQQNRILIRDCLSFPELGDRYFRLAVRTRSENQSLVTAVKDILADQ